LSHGRNLYVKDLIALREVLPQIRGYASEKVTIGRSASAVYRLQSPGKPTLFLKMATDTDATMLIAEHDRLHWLSGKAFVPTVAGFASQPNQVVLLTEALPGVNGAEVPASIRSRVTKEFAWALRELHSLDLDECPFDQTLEQILPCARARAMSGCVDESDFDVERLGLSAIELLGPLYQNRPKIEDVVVTHGDACLPNAVFEDGTFSGFVDCGRVGRADRYQDLALAARSIDRNFGGEFAAEFLDAYGIDGVAADKVSYYQLLDEFF
jgi:aminoglycoside 3'-phosphotransferase II